MKEKKKISTFTIIIIVLSVLVSIELIIILRNVFSIKSENGKLKYDIYKLNQENKKLSDKNKALEKMIKNFQEPKLITQNVPEGWKVFRHLDLGFEVGLPQSWTAETGVGGKGKPVLNIMSDNSSVKVEVSIEDIKDYWSIENYVSKKYKYNLYVKESTIINNQKIDIYKQSGTKKYYILIMGKNNIYEVSSTSEEYLKKIFATFKFI